MLIDLRKIFGVWEYCPGSRFWRKAVDPPHPNRPDYRVYVNPLEGVMISAREHLASDGLAYEIFVRSAQGVDDAEWQASQKRVQPWVWRTLSVFFTHMILVDALRRDPEAQMRHLLAAYKKQSEEFLRTGRGHEDPGLDELLAATVAMLVDLEGSMAVETTILKDELPEFLSTYGIHEC